MKKGIKKTVQLLLEKADVKIDGDRPWDIKVHDDRLYARVIAQGSLGFGEAYMDGWWDCDAIDQLINRIMTAKIESHLPIGLSAVRTYASAVLMNQGSKKRAFEVGQKHYDVGNDLYKAMLDKRMVYTCGYWKHATTLDEAQEAKLDLVCKKIGLRSGQTVLDIGCGWGSFAKFAAETYGAKVVGVTVSKEQVALGQELCKGLPVEFRLQDYRDIEGQFDHIVSLGMFEHVGYKNYREFMTIANRCLKDDGLFLLHTIGGNHSAKKTDDWIAKYIFPNSMLPSAKQITAAMEGKFMLEDWHNFGTDYDKTLMAWFANFDNAWPSLKKEYDDRFYRMWKFYLLCCAGTFRMRHNQLWQIVLSKKGAKGGYESIR